MTSTTEETAVRHQIVVEVSVERAFEVFTELEHLHLDRHGAGWESARDGVSGDGGWPLYLERFAEVASRS